MFDISSTFDLSVKNCSSPKKFNSLAIISWQSNSIKEPNESCVKCALSFFDVLLEPSAKFEDIEIDALRNWLTKPNFSSEGNSFVIL